MARMAYSLYGFAFLSLSPALEQPLAKPFHGTGGCTDLLEDHNILAVLRAGAAHCYCCCASLVCLRS